MKYSNVYPYAHSALWCCVQKCHFFHMHSKVFSKIVHTYKHKCENARTSICVYFFLKNWTIVIIQNVQAMLKIYSLHMQRSIKIIYYAKNNIIRKACIKINKLYWKILIKSTFIQTRLIDWIKETIITIYNLVARLILLSCKSKIMVLHYIYYQTDNFIYDVQYKNYFYNSFIKRSSQYNYY